MLERKSKKWRRYITTEEAGCNAPLVTNILLSRLNLGIMIRSSPLSWMEDRAVAKACTYFERCNEGT